jgi:hypothetical protein
MPMTEKEKKEILDELASTSLRNEVRKIISFSSAHKEQQSQQGRSVFDLRRIEFEAADKIIAIVRGRTH